MARFAGKVGYGETQEDPTTGDHTVVITEVQAYGDVKRDTRRLVDADERVNRNVTVGNSIEVLAGPFEPNNFYNIIYVWWMGKPWVVDNVEVKYPRLILSLGDLYTGVLGGDD